MTINKTLKIVAYTIEAAIIITLIALAIAVGVKNKNIKAQKAEIENLQCQVDSLNSHCNELAMMESLRVEVTFQFTQKNVLSFSANNMQNIAKEICYLTRGELLDSLKSDKGLKVQK